MRVVNRKRIGILDCRAAAHFSGAFRQRSDVDAREVRGHDGKRGAAPFTRHRASRHSRALSHSAKFGSAVCRHARACRGHPRRDAARLSESGLAGKPWRPRADAKRALPVFSKIRSYGILKNQPSMGRRRKGQKLGQNRIGPSGLASLWNHSKPPKESLEKLGEKSAGFGKARQKTLETWRRRRRGIAALRKKPRRLTIGRRL